jgi:glycosyltransferase involved in cell wall biosynthesis
MLEAMACGALPVMGRLESIEEWIEDGRNGILFDSEQPDEIEVALCSALSNRELCENAQMINRKIIEDRANVENALPQLFDFYHTVIQS